MTSTSRIKRCSISSLLLWLLPVLQLVVVEGFVTVPQVQRSTLHSTATAVTYEPAHVLTNAFNRNPFAVEDEEENSPQSLSSSSSEWETSAEMSVSGANSIASLAGLDESLGKTSYDNTGRVAVPWWWLARSAVQSERARRKLQKNLRVATHHFLRDSGLLRAIMDFLVSIGTPSLALENPDIVPRFLQLTKECIHIPYGAHKMQGIDIYLPPNHAEKKPRGLLYFVHGGAWGSGQPWMYRLVAQPFLDRGMAVAIVGYRTFPDGTVQDQVEDLELAAQTLAERYPEFCSEKSDMGVTVMGHSSGAHIAMQMLVNRLQQQLGLPRDPTTCKKERNAEHSMRIDSFIGISAPYEIASHYEFEKTRCLEELSPMKPACGNKLETLSEYSPVLQLFQKITQRSFRDKQCLDELSPRIALLHGVNDDTVPYTATKQAAKLLRLSGVSNCDEMYLSETGHSETVFELMFGGKTQDILIRWLETTAPSK